MNAQENATPDAAMQEIWSQLDAEDAGTASAPIPSHSHSAASTEHRPAPAQADAHMGAMPGSPNEQNLMDKIAGLESNFNQVAQRLRHAEGHIGGLNSQLKQAQQQAQQAAHAAPSAAELRNAQGNPEAMSSLKRDYPEFASAMESVLNERLSGLEQRINAQHQAQPQHAAVSPEELTIMRREIEVEIQHPGWQKTVVAPEFLGWLNRQSREVQMLANSPDPQDAVRLLDIHNETTGASTAKRNQRLSAAAAIPSGRGGGYARQKPTEEMTQAEYWRYLDEIDKSKG